jgi:hypothetical protein
MNVGWKIVPVLKKRKCREISESIKNDIVNTTFGLADELDNFNKCPNKWELFTNPQLREEYLDNPKCIWKNNFTHKPYVSKSCGMANIFHNPLVREEILFNEEIINPILEEYGEEAIYAKGTERVSIKVKGSTDMERHIDTNYVNYEKRIQAFVTLEIDPSEDMKNKGSIEILSNFSNYFDYYPLFISKHPEYKGELTTTDKLPVKLDKFFINSIDDFNTWLKENFYTKKLTKKFLQFKEEHPIPPTFQEIKWEYPPIKTGDLFIWDCRLPHRNTKNKSDIPRIVAYVSLYPISTWENLGKPNIYNMFIGKTKSLNGEKNRDNEEEKSFYEDEWEDRVSIDKTNPLVQKLLHLE